MKKFVHRFFLFQTFILLVICQQLYAQEIPSKQALYLIKQNSSFLNLSSDDIDNSIISDAYFDHTSNTQLIYLQQSYRGIPVYHSIQVIALKNDHAVSVEGKRVAKIEEKIIGSKEGAPVVSATQAVSVAARELKIQRPAFLKLLRTDNTNRNVEFSSAISKENITSNLMWVAGNDGKIRLGWQVKIVPHNSNAYWLVRLNANDETILGKDNLTLSDNWGHPVNKAKQILSKNNLLSNSNFQQKLKLSPQTILSSDYEVIPFPEEAMSFPGGTPVLVSNPWLSSGSSNQAISLGWHNDGTTDYSYTRGNNVWAKEDHAGTNSNTGAAATSTSAAPYLTFDFPFYADQEPDTGSDMNFAITQLFYWNNVMHDVSYQYGFDEASGNFQNNNQGRGGAGNDFVYADAQDGSGTNNANFSTPADGSNPRMQMFLWSPDQSKNLNINSPASIAGPMPSLEGSLSINNLLKNVGPVTGDIILYNDDVSGTTHLACGSAANAGALAGKIAMIDRGGCNFTVKIKNAQLAGAIAVIMVNNTGGDSILVMGGSDNTITIPAVMITQNDGNTIKSLLVTSTVVNATLSANSIQLDGDFDNGIMAHEYTHGISNRLTGGPSTATCLTNAEQGGEGWSDYMALMMTTNWATASSSDGTKARSLGTYVLAEQPTDPGIRTYPYSTDLSINPWTYGQLAGTGGEVHVIGEIWAATLW
ncbi:MAG: M36 family metallopeptidase, partial [Bacteroidota bacterium]|nr:M36 family metallopeptidase [Bacteroidota bacterium]